MTTKAQYAAMTPAAQLQWRKDNGHRAYMELMRGKVAPAPTADPKALAASVRRMAAEIFAKTR